MIIANPIYDVVFKYLMEDSRLAKLLIGTIIGEKIDKIYLRPTDEPVKLAHKSWTVYRLDFSAKIKTPGGLKTVIIEIQKAKYSTDIISFRRYLGKQYLKDDNIYIEKSKGRTIKKAIPIISIYFLGKSLSVTKAPVIKVQRNYIDITTGKEIKEKEDFIESLTHDSYVIQIPCLREKIQSELEILLSIFDQRNKTENHILNVKEEQFPAKFHPLIRKLQKGAAEPELLSQMDAEDQVLEELQELEREAEESKRE
ncbi:MAG: hypothetical protein KJ607_11950, partial [Bacteroidetes bacterium]|nr:hypothetical protein [Bacteroidota bacterium]